MEGASLSVQSRPGPAATPQELSCPPSRPPTRARAAPTDTTGSPTTLLASGTLETMVRFQMDRWPRTKPACFTPTFTAFCRNTQRCKKQLKPKRSISSLLSVFQTEETGRGTVSTCTQETATSRGKETGITPTTSTATRITTRTGAATETRTAARGATATTAPPGKDRTTSTATTGTTGGIGPITTGQH